MMGIKVNWEKLTSIQKRLMETGNLTGDSEVTFTMIMSDKTAKKKVVPFKEFLSFFWTLAEDSGYDVLTLIVQDSEGRIIYRHKTLTAGNEEIPVGGNGHVVSHWNAFNSQEKDVFLDILISQINSYDQ